MTFIDRIENFLDEVEREDPTVAFLLVITGALLGAALFIGVVALIVAVEPWLFLLIAAVLLFLVVRRVAGTIKKVRSK